MSAPRKPRVGILDPLHPPGALLIKLGSLIVHHEEAASKKAHPLDGLAIKNLREDPEVEAWMEAMARLALLPMKR